MSPTVVPFRATVAFASNRTGALQIYLLDRPAQPPVADYADRCLTCPPGNGFLRATDPAWAPGLHCVQLGTG